MGEYSPDYRDVTSQETINSIFKENPILNDFSLTNMIIAGGCITSMIQKLSGFEKEIKSDDIDIFMYQINDEEAFQKIKELVEAGLKIDKETIFHRTTFAYTIESPNGLYKKIQIINNIYSGPLAVLNSFDIYSSQVGIHLQDQQLQLLTTQKGFESLEYRIQVIDKDLENFHFDSRVVKYFNRGYNLVLPYLNPKSFSEDKIYFIGFYITIHVLKIYNSYIQAKIYISYRSHTFKKPKLNDSHFYDCQNSENLKHEGENVDINGVNLRLINSRFTIIDEEFYRFSNGMSSGSIENVFDFFRTLHHRKNFYCGYTLEKINSADEAITKIFDGRYCHVIYPYQFIDICPLMELKIYDDKVIYKKRKYYQDHIFLELVRESYKTFNIKRFTNSDSIFANEKTIPICSWYRCELDIHEYISEIEKDILIKYEHKIPRYMIYKGVNVDYIGNIIKERKYEYFGGKIVKSAKKIE
jgi:hypothetical protein